MPLCLTHFLRKNQQFYLFFSAKYKWVKYMGSKNFLNFRLLDSHNYKILGSVIENVRHLYRINEMLRYLHM